MSKFEKRFFKAITEAIEDEKEAFELELDDDTSSEDFDIDMEADTEIAEVDPAVKAAEAMGQANAAMVSTLKGWIASGDDFLKKLNDSEDPNSISYAIGNAEPDTLFDKMQGEQRRISKVATDLAALNETMRGYLAQSDNPILKGV
jgi:hypothetical protein|tara:strand:- start:2000 stop:2437 length:438 start_codon:yes stop_codon:yes gene_type:complete